MAGDGGRDVAPEQAFADGAPLDEREAIRLFYERYGPRVRSYCLRRLGNLTDADDALQETFLKAQRGLHRFDRSAPVWPWLVTIAAHVCTDIHRAHGHVAAQTSEPLDVATAEPDEVVALRARATLVDDALRSLPARYRTSLYMRHFEGASYEEIARSQGTSIASVKSVLMRSRRELGSRIEALARIERQWPLPSTVSLVARRARERLRVWQREVERVLQAAVGVVDSVVSLGAVVANGPAAMVALGAWTATAGGAFVPPQVHVQVQVPKAASVPASVPLDASGPDIELTSHQGGRGVAIGGRPAIHGDEPPFFSLDPPRPPFVPNEAVPPGGVQAREHHDGGMDVYVHPLRLSVWTDCMQTFFERLACSTARTVLPIVDKHDPGAPDAGVEIDPHASPSP